MTNTNEHGITTKYTLADILKCLDAFEEKFEEILDAVDMNGPRSDLWLYNKLWCAKENASGSYAEDAYNDIVEGMFYLAQKIGDELVDKELEETNDKARGH